MKPAIMNKVQSWLTELIQKTAPTVQKEVKKVVQRSTTNLKDQVMSAIPAIVMVACMVDGKSVKQAIAPTCTDAVNGVTFIFNEYRNTYNYNYYRGEK